MNKLSVANLEKSDQKSKSLLRVCAMATTAFVANPVLKRGRNVGTNFASRTILCPHLVLVLRRTLVLKLNWLGLELLATRSAEERTLVD